MLVSCTGTEAWWHIGMSSASHREDPGSNPGKGRFFRIKMKNVTVELLCCSYSLSCTGVQYQVCQMLLIGPKLADLLFLEN